MRELNIPRDEIFSFFARPGRKLNPAFIGEIASGMLGSGIPAALDEEVDRYVKQRLAENAISAPKFLKSEFSALRLFPLMEKAFGVQYSFLDDESELFEYKIKFSDNLKSRLKIYKAMASFANHRGGYIFIGVNDCREVMGIDDSSFEGITWDRFSQEIRSFFIPLIQWDRQAMRFAERTVGVISISEAAKKPVVCAKDYDKIIYEGVIYFRYRGLSELIKPNELMNMLADRDRNSVEAARYKYFQHLRSDLK
ncbi:MAG: ATP-binding protein [Pseudomonadota bacterium]